MPLNTLRLNHRPSTHPNDRIVFIKPLPRPAHRQHEYNLADTFLRAIAAQCLPIMKTHWLSVTTLEEFEPNSEFMGRNFNAGECIQLVLQRKKTTTTTTTTTKVRYEREEADDAAAAPRWLPFEVVQMVMMHELAHNVHMNHAKAFWETRNVFAAELKALWARGYTGDGFWSGGRTLGDLTTLMQDDGGGGFVGSAELADLPLCGGTYRSRRGGKRKRKKGEAGGSRALTWKERKEQRIEKKFGKNGVTLGEDEETRMVLELGRRGNVGGKPRVAGSKRGRELRAAAALKRFEVAKVKQEEQDEEEGEDEASDEYDDEEGDSGEEALDIDGKRLHDKEGRVMTRVCEVGSSGDVHVKQELEELEGLDRYFIRTKDDDDHVRQSANPPPSSSPSHRTTKPPSTPAAANATATANATPPSTQTTISCPICSLDNPSTVSTCSACAHVLDINKDPRHWACPSAACQDTAYINGGDAGLCSLCGGRKPPSPSPSPRR